MYLKKIPGFKFQQFVSLMGATVTLNDNMAFY